MCIHHICFMFFFAELTQRKIQECVKMGITVDITTDSLPKGHFDHNKDDCGNVTSKDEGLLSLSYLIIPSSKAY